MRQSLIYLCVQSGNGDIEVTAPLLRGVGSFIALALGQLLIGRAQIETAAPFSAIAAARASIRSNASDFPALSRQIGVWLLPLCLICRTW